MHRRHSPRILGLTLGALLGGVAGALVFRLLAPEPAPTPPTAAPPPSAWSWREGSAPLRLTDSDQAATAIAGWRTLRAADGGPADFPARAAALRALLLRLPKPSFPRLLDQLSATDNSPDTAALREIAFLAWVEIDPAAAARWGVSRPELRDLLRDALDAWSAADPRAAAIWACSLPDEKLAGNLAYFILPALAEIDASAAMSLATARGQNFRQRLLPGALAVLAKRDPAGTVQTFGPQLWERGNGLFELQNALGAWANRAPAAAISWVLTQPKRLDWDPSINLRHLPIQAANRAAFAQALLDAPGFLRRQSALGGYLLDWLRDDSAAALAWLNKVPDPSLRSTLLEKTISEQRYQTGGDLAPVLKLALALPDGESRQYQLSRLLGDLAQNSPTDALRWIDAHKDDADVTAASFAAHAAILGVIARDDPAAAVAEWQKLPAGKTKHQGVFTIVAEWGQRDPAAALQWQVAQASPDYPVYPSRQMIYQWARKDAVAALRWAESLPGEMPRFALLSLTNDGGNRTPPAAALELYAQIKNPARRTETLTTHVREWLTTDPAAAKTWLESHDALTPAQAAVLLQAR